MPSSSHATKRTTISDAAIKKHRQDERIRQLTEPGSSLVFRYSTSDRERGSFHLRHYQDGEERWARVGKFPDITTKQARNNYHRMKETLFITPDTRAIIDRLDTMGDLLQWYQGRVERNERNNEITKERARAVIGMIGNHLIPALAEKQVLTLSKAEVDREVIQPLFSSQYAPSYVRGILVVLKQATKAARALDLLTIDPLAGWTYKDFGTARVRPSAPLLNQTDLPDVVAAMPPAGRTRLLMQLMLSLGLRIGEASALRWRWFDFDREMVHIPAHVTKTGAQLDLPLTSQVVTILVRWKGAQRRNAAFVFPGQKGRSLHTSQLHKEIKAATGGAWTARQLRKLARTLLAAHGVDYYVGERILNHSQGTLDATYNAALLETQKRTALTDHSDYLDGFGVYE